MVELEIFWSNPLQHERKAIKLSTKGSHELSRDGKPMVFTGRLIDAKIYSIIIVLLIRKCIIIIYFRSGEKYLKDLKHQKSEEELKVQTVKEITSRQLIPGQFLLFQQLE